MQERTAFRLVATACAFLAAAGLPGCRSDDRREDAQGGVTSSIQLLTGGSFAPEAAVSFVNDLERPGDGRPWVALD